MNLNHVKVKPIKFRIQVFYTQLIKAYYSRFIILIDHF
jgi:hypothetical protein